MPPISTSFYTICREKTVSKCCQKCNLNKNVVLNVVMDVLMDAFHEQLEQLCRFENELG